MKKKSSNLNNRGKHALSENFIESQMDHMSADLETSWKVDMPEDERQFHID